MPNVVEITRSNPVFAPKDYIIGKDDSIYLVTNMYKKDIAYKGQNPNDITLDRLDAVCVVGPKAGEYLTNMWQGAFEKFIGELNIITY